MAMALRTLISRPPSSLASLSPLFSARFFASKSISIPLLARPAPLLRLRPFVSLAEARWSPAPARRGAGLKCFSTRATTSSLNDPSPNWSNRPPKETILLDGCDFEHWLVVMEPPEGNPTRDEIIDSYIKTLAQIVGSEEEARKKIYSVSTRHYFAFGALVSEELSYKIKPLPRVRWVLPDSYLDVKNKDYGGEPFIDGQAVPYDPKYHEEWVRNNARANERSRRNDRPRNFDRSRNFERRRENMQNRDFQTRDVPPMPNQDFQNRGVQNPMPPAGMPPSMSNRDGQNVMPPRDLPPMPNRDGQNVIPPSAQYSNSNPGAMPNPSFQGRDGPNLGGAPNRDYQNQGPNNQSNYVPNRDGRNMQGGGNAYQSGGSYMGGGGAYQGSGNANQGGGGGGGGYPGPNPGYQGGGGAGYQGGGGGGGGGYPGPNPGYQGGGGAGYPGPNPVYQGGGAGYVAPNNAYQGGGNAYQGRDMPGRD